jgi:hypothetical protein
MIRRVPNQPKTPKHNFRVSDELWNEARRLAAENGENLSEELRRFLERYIRSRQKRSDDE